MLRFFTFFAILLLCACSSVKTGEQVLCPKTGLLPEAAIITSLTPAGQKVFTAAFTGFSGSCRPKGNDMYIDLSLPFSVKKINSNMKLEKVDLPYFISVLSAEEKVLQRQSFSTNVFFDNAEIGVSAEEHVIKIPLTSPADQYKVVIGFVLTPDQLKYNKEHNK